MVGEEAELRVGPEAVVEVRRLLGRYPIRSMFTSFRTPASQVKNRNPGICCRAAYQFW
jgi:hypothetical protein